MSWTTVGDIRRKVKSRWDDGSLLQAHAAGAPFPDVDVPIRRPRPSEVGDRLGEVQAWVATLTAGSRSARHYTLQLTPIGGRLIGRNELPSRAIVTSYDQAWALLDVGPQVAVYDEVLASAEPVPAIREWVGRHPHKAIGLAGDWERVIAAYRWLDEHRGSGRYLREISAPGVDTKFAERHRGVLAELLGVPARGFTGGLGLRAKPTFTRLRPDPRLEVLPPATELALRHDELPYLAIEVREALVVENEITYLSVPVPAGGVVLWGKGFDVDRAGSLPWLRGAAVTYWGDLDTHGFAILNRLRAWLPQTRSVLMDRETLLAHRERWGSEDSPTSARLENLSAGETAVYNDLVEDRLGHKLRLEQERIDWSWVEARLPG
jgi:hypothetical protein